LHTGTLTAKGQIVLPASGESLPEYVPPFAPGTHQFSAAERHLHNTFGHTLGDPE
jgi:hypothetical protein